MEMMSWIRQQAEMLVLIQLFLYFASELHMRSSENLQPQLQRSGSGRINGSDRNHYSGGIFNMFGNYFFVFTLDRGIMGAGIATSMGSVFSLIIMLTHFFKKKNSLHLEKPTQLLVKLRAIGTTGFSTFFIDVAMGILTMIFNRQCSEHCHRYYPQIWHFIHFAAVQHFLHLLFPGNDEAFYRFCCVRGKRCGHQRRTDLSAACHGGSK